MGAAALPAAASGAQAGAGVFSSWAQGQAGKSTSAYYGYLAHISRSNADLAEKAGESQVKEIGAEELDQDRALGNRVRSTVGAQKAALAAGGGVGSKTAEQIIKDTANKGNLDEIALRYNAELKSKAARTGADFRALNERSQAAGYDMSGLNAESEARMNQFSTILGSGASVASTWARYR